MQGSTCNFLEGLCVITEGFWIQEKERCSVNRGYIGTIIHGTYWG